MPFCKQFKLSIPEREKLIRIKSRTGIQNWNVICRWAFCWSLGEPTVPQNIEPLSDSNVEMTWFTFAGEYHEIYEQMLRTRCRRDGLACDDATLLRYFRLHLSRGISHFSSRGVLKNIFALLRLPDAER